MKINKINFSFADEVLKFDDWLLEMFYFIKSSKLVNLNGSIKSELKGKWDKTFDVILKLGKKK